MVKPPARWDQYSKCGKRIEGTPFIAFKVPLAERYFANNDPSNALPENAAPWTMEMLKDAVPDLKVVIDLTFTTKYYNASRMNSYNLKHIKIGTEGQKVPKPSVVQRFFQRVDETLRGNPDVLIGVHCTHGVNRTGYFICRYMIEKLRWKADDAIDAFGSSRGHAIHRQYLIDDLKKGSWDRRPSADQPSRNNRDGRSRQDRSPRTSRSSHHHWHQQAYHQPHEMYDAREQIHYHQRMPNNVQMGGYNNWRRHDQGNHRASNHYEQNSGWGNYGESRGYGSVNFYAQDQHHYGGYARDNFSQSHRQPRAPYDSRSDSYHQDSDRRNGNPYRWRAEQRQ